MGDLSRVARFVKVVVFVNSAPHYAEQHVVADGAADLLVRTFGDRIGRPARSAVGSGYTAARVCRGDRGHRRDVLLRAVRAAQREPGRNNVEPRAKSAAALLWRQQTVRRSLEPWLPGPAPADAFRLQWPIQVPRAGRFPECSRCASPADSSALTILVIAGADTCSSSASLVTGCGPAKTNTESSEARGPSRSRSASAARATRSSRTVAECTKFAVS